MRCDGMGWTRQLVRVFVLNEKAAPSSSSLCMCVCVVEQSTVCIACREERGSEKKKGLPARHFYFLLFYHGLIASAMVLF